MQSKAKTVDEYLKNLSTDRRKDIQNVRKVILNNLPKGYKEGMQYGMIGYYIPLKIYPNGYLNDGKTPLPYISLASQKNHMAVYLNNIYMNKKINKWFIDEYKKSRKRIDMGKSCVRFKKIEDLPIELIGKAVAKTSVDAFIKEYEKSRKK